MYWLAVVMVSVFGTMLADGIHSATNVPYWASTLVFAAVLAGVLVGWYRSEDTLDVHSIHTRRREGYYWATVVATFALGTAAGDMTASSFHLGYVSSVVIFAVVIVIPAVGYWRFGMNAIFGFWFAYVVTRPLGASSADWMAVPRRVGGLGFGTGWTTLLMTAGILCFVAYLALTRTDVEVVVEVDADVDGTADARGRRRDRRRARGLTPVGTAVCDDGWMAEPVVRWTRASARPDMWVDPQDDPRESATSGTDERSILLDYLRRYRITLELKCADLDAEQLSRRSVPPSTMSLLGLVRHMAEVERGWFRRVMNGLDAAKLYCTADSPDEDWLRRPRRRGRRGTGLAGLACRGRVRRGVHGTHRRPGDDGPHPARRGGPAAGRPRAHDRGVRAALRPRGPAPGVHRRPDRSVAPGPKLSYRAATSRASPETKEATVVVMEAPDICLNVGCSRRFDADKAGWDGTCDECAALAEDHFSGVHADADPTCPFCA